VDFAVTELEPKLKALVGQRFADVQGIGRWEGEFNDGVVSGRLMLDRFQLAGVAAQGDIDISAKGVDVTLRPSDLSVREPNLAGQTARLSGGSVTVDLAGLRVEQLATWSGGLGLWLDGHWDWAERGGQFKGSWVGRLPEDGCLCEGTGEVVVRSPLSGRKEADVRVTAALDGPLGSGDVVLATQGTGADWQVSNWKVSVSKLAWSHGDRQISISEALAEVALAWPEIHLTRLLLGEARRVRAEAAFDANTQQWSVHMDANGLEPEGYAGPGVDLTLNGTGNARQATISRFSLKAGPNRLIARGTLPLSGGRLEDVHFAADWPGGSSEPNRARPTSRSGHWHYEADVVGKTSPLELEVTGALSGRDVRLGEKTVERVEILLRAEVDANQVNVATEVFDLLGGRCQVNGRHGLSDRITQLALSIDGLSLKAAAEMAGSPVQCRGAAKAQLHLAVPAFNVQKAVATGSWHAENVAIEPFEAGKARGKLRVSDGLVRFDGIHLIQGAGQADGSMQFRLERPQLLSIAFKADGWPLEFTSRPIKLCLDSEVDATVDVLAKTIDGQGQLSGAILWQGKQFGDMVLSGSIGQRTLEIPQLSGRVLGGSVEGSLRIPLDQWTGSTGQLTWRDLQLQNLRQWSPVLADLEGRLAGSLRLLQTRGQPRALEPMQVKAHTEVTDAWFGPARIGDADFSGYIGPTRFLVDGASLHLFGGDARMRARVSRHADRFHALVVTDFNNLSVDQFAHFIDPNDPSFAGNVHGRITVLLSSDLRAFGGDVTVKLEDSDLVNNSVVQTLYNALSLDSTTAKPTGTGQIQMRLEGRTLEIPGFVYFNRGVEIRGAGSIEDISLGARSRVEGYAVGSTRVLKAIRLPGVRELDRLMASLQTALASAQTQRTLGEPEVEVVPLPVVSNAFRRLLWSQLKE
jgi:hypothetical protein